MLASSDSSVIICRLTQAPCGPRVLGPATHVWPWLTEPSIWAEDWLEIRQFLPLGRKCFLQMRQSRIASICLMQTLGLWPFSFRHLYYSSCPTSSPREARFRCTTWLRETFKSSISATSWPNRRFCYRFQFYFDDFVKVHTIFHFHRIYFCG